MLRPARFKLLVSALAACSCALVTSAQTASQPTQKPAAPRPATQANPAALPAPAKTGASVASASTTPANVTAPRTRAISPAVAAQLRAATTAPQFAPPPTPPPQTTPLVDAREVDRPRNDIIRLPDYVVLEKKPQVFAERDVNTKQGLTDIAMRRHISETDYVMNRFYVPLFGSSVQNRAMAMYAEQERLNNISTASDMAIGANMGDPAQGSLIRKEAQKTFMRTEDYGWNNGNNTDRK